MKLDCTAVRDALGEHATGTLRAQTEEEVKEHLASCPVCAQKATEMRATLTTLRALRPPTLPSGFDDRLRARLEAAGPPDPAPPAPPPAPAFRAVAPARSSLPIVLGGLVAAGAIAAALLLTGGGPRTRAMPAASVSLSMSGPSRLYLAFDADAPQAGCEIRVRTPPEVGLEGAGPDGELVLRRDLAAGPNRIAVTMSGKKPGSYRLVASASIGARRVTQDIYVQVGP